jgi:hypothetical protein
MQQGNGTISQSELMKKLANSKKIMNKVDGGDYQRGHVDESVLFSSPEELMTKNQQPSQPSQPTQSYNQPNPNNGLDVSRIEKSKLPDAIKRAMIENPINQISLNDTIDMDIIKGAKRLIEQENRMNGNNNPQPTKNPQPTYTPQSVQQQTIPSTFDINAISIIIENTVRKVLDEKLNQLLSAQQTTNINESLVLKVGDSIFRGTITGVNKAK